MPGLTESIGTTVTDIDLVCVPLPLSVLLMPTVALGTERRGHIVIDRKRDPGVAHRRAPDVDDADSQAGSPVIA